MNTAKYLSSYDIYHLAWWRTFSSNAGVIIIYCHYIYSAHFNFYIYSALSFGLSFITYYLRSMPEFQITSK